jgi:hypothetical protein
LQLADCPKKQDDHARAQSPLPGSSIPLTAVNREVSTAQTRLEFVIGDWMVCGDENFRRKGPSRPTNCNDEEASGTNTSAWRRESTARSGRERDTRPDNLLNMLLPAQHLSCAATAQELPNPK